MLRPLKKLLVVGAGTAGLITALILKKKFDTRFQIDVLYSDKIGIIGVGEGSTEHFKDFLEFMEIDQYDLIRKCGSTYKSGIYFEGWSEQPYLHSVQYPFNKKHAQYNYVYGKQISEGSSFLVSPNFIENKINTWYIDKPTEFPCNQFHFNTFKLNEFLIDLCKKMNINLIEDEVKDIKVDESNFIYELVGEKQSYNYDFFIDATGFKRLLINKVGAKWNSFGKYLKMKSAVVFPTEDTNEYNLWTLAKAMDAGWMFRIPVWGRHGNGYIFDSDYIDFEDAKKEVQKHFDKEIQFGKEFRFDPGCLDEVWINNCCAVGLSGSFVEPLEASSIGTSIQQAFLLMHYLPAYTKESVDRYNKCFTDIMLNIRDFIFLHYLTEKTNTQFWKDVSKIEIPDSLYENLLLWKNKLPIKEDFSNLSNYILFREDNYTLVMEGLNLFDRDSIRLEHDMSNEMIKNDADESINKQIEFLQTSNFISHKDFISIIRKQKSFSQL